MAFLTFINNNNAIIHYILYFLQKISNFFAILQFLIYDYRKSVFHTRGEKMLEFFRKNQKMVILFIVIVFGFWTIGMALLPLLFN